MGLIIRECVGHEQAVNKLNPHNFDGLLSVAKDCQVRIWSLGLDLWGIIDCRHFGADELWYFPSRDKRQREVKDIMQMQLMVDQLRSSNEQAVMIERDSLEGEEEKDQFTSKGTYKKFKG